jgi:hypothetical protein
MKPALEFFDPKDLPWSEILPGVEEKILSKDPKTGLYSRLLRMKPGSKIDKVLVHDFCEELFIVEGELKDESTGEIYKAGMYSCRPPGMKHGPFSTEKGCEIFEVRYACKE